MPLRAARFPAARCLFQEINTAGVGVFSRYVIEGMTRAVETDSGERNRRAARDTCNKCRRARNPEPLVQTISISANSHGSPSSGFNVQVTPRRYFEGWAQIAFRLELCIVDYFIYAELPRTCGIVLRPSCIGLEKTLTQRISSIESDATVLAFLLWLRRRPL